MIILFGLYNAISKQIFVLLTCHILYIKISIDHSYRYWFHESTSNLEICAHARDGIWLAIQYYRMNDIVIHKHISLLIIYLRKDQFYKILIIMIINSLSRDLRIHEIECEGWNIIRKVRVTDLIKMKMIINNV